jgi:hypothetical protein
MVAMNVWPTDAADGAVSSEARWRLMARQWVPSGVVRGAGGELAPSLAGTNLTVRSGAAWVDGHYTELPGDQVLTATANGLAVVRFDPAANTAELLYRDGATTPNRSPIGVWELPVALIAGSALADRRALLAGEPSTFPNAAARSLAGPAPTAGKVSYLTDTKLLQVYDGAWQTVTGVGSTGLAYNERLVATGGVGSAPAEITDLRTPFTTPGGHRVRLSGGGQFQQQGAAATMHLYLNEDGIGVAAVDQYADPAGAFMGLFASRIIVPAAGTHQYSLWISTDGGTIIGAASANRPIWISVEDLG